MFGYAATAATATEALLPFEDAPLITNPGGLLEQAVAVEEAIDTAAANQLMNNVPQALQHRSNSRLPTTLNARDQPPAEVSDQRVSGLTGAVQHRHRRLSRCSPR